MLSHRHKSSSRTSWIAVLGFVFKVGVSAAVIYTLYQQIFIRQDVTELYRGFAKALNWQGLTLCLAITLLLPFNILLEAVKFRLLLQHTEQDTLSLFTSVKRVLSGITLGFFTPNRVGEYAGRMVGETSASRTGIIAATFLGGIAQWIALVSFGLIGSLSLAGSLATHDQYVLPGIWLSIGLLAGFLALYAALPQAVGFLRKHTSPRANAPTGRVKTYLFASATKFEAGLGSSAQVRWQVLGLATLRYSIYLLQLSLAFVAFGVEISWALLLSGTAVLLLIQTFLPLPAVLQSFARVEIALVLWQAYNPNVLALGAASLFIFVLNLGLPALVGLGIILRTDVAQTLTTKPI